MVRAAWCLSLVTVLAAAGCLEPKPFRCVDDSQCGPGQRCSSQQVCAPAEVDAATEPDAGTGAPDGPAPDRPWMPTLRQECMEGVELSPDHSPCAAAVCARQPDCCTVGWTHACVKTVEVEAACGRSCSQAVYSAYDYGFAIAPSDGATWTAHTFAGDATLYAAPADYDADGDLDVGYVTDKGWGVKRNNRDGTFSHVAGGTIERFVGRHAVWGDWDGDGDLDLALAGLSEPMPPAPLHALWLVWNTADGLTRAPAPVDSDEQLLQLDSADLDGDGDLDLVAGTYAGTLRVRRFENDGQGRFTRAPHADLLGTDGVRLCQLIGDRHPELITTGDGFARVFAGASGGFATAPVLRVDGSGWRRARCGDLDGDGDLDLILHNRATGEVRVFRVTDGALVEPAAWSLTVAGTVAIDVGDVDGDHRLDLVVQSMTSGPQLLRNTTASATAPIELAAPASIASPGVGARHDVALAPAPAP